MADRLKYSIPLRKCLDLFIFLQMLGAMSARGYDLLSMYKAPAEAIKHLATHGVCFSACSLPGQPHLFEIAPDEMELGAGVHGEAGMEKLETGTAKEIVVLILDKIVAHQKLSEGSRVAVMINNMGGTSLMDINIIAAEIKDYLDLKQIKIERMISGHLQTSLEMQGFQICLLHLNKEHGDLWLQLLDAPTEAVGWTGGVMSVRDGDGIHGEGIHDDDIYGDDDMLLQCNEIKKGPSLLVKEQEILRGSLKAAAEELVRSEELLNRLDSGCGDEDCGTTFKNFGKAVLSYLETASLEYPLSVIWDLSVMAETDMRGTSGRIYSYGFAAASKAILNATTNDRRAWLAAWESAMQAITKYGGARPGEKTMIDTLHSALLVYKENLNTDLKTALKMTVEAAEKGSKVTATMSARAGRASYVASEYVNDEDAGARAVAIWLRAILDHIADKY